MDARDLLRRVRHLELSTRRAVQGTLSGRYRSTFRGRGVAVDDVRRYAPGDEVRSIDWNVTARRGELHVKRFVEERELTVLIAVDLSGSTHFGSGRRTKRDAAAEVAALLGASAVANGDRVGLALFTSTVERFVAPRRGRRHLMLVLRELLGHEPRSPRTDVAAAIQFLLRVQRRSAALFLLSDFDDDGWHRALAMARRRYDVVPVVFGDRRERDPPRAGLALLEDPETGAVVAADLSDDRVRAAIAAAHDARRSDRERAFQRLGLGAVEIDADAADLALPIVAGFARPSRRTR